jgi:hypothetical protein
VIVCKAVLCLNENSETIQSGQFQNGLIKREAKEAFSRLPCKFQFQNGLIKRQPIDRYTSCFLEVSIPKWSD